MTESGDNGQRGLAAHSHFSRSSMHCSDGTLGLNCLKRSQLKKAVGEGTEGGEREPKAPVMGWGT